MEIVNTLVCVFIVWAFGVVIETQLRSISSALHRIAEVMEKEKL